MPDFVYNPVSTDEACVLLGVLKTATSDEIRAAYRRRVKEVHPDRNGGVLNNDVDLHRLRLARDVLLDAILGEAWS